jgi:7-cyano-7-deazaguanine synthase
MVQNSKAFLPVNLLPEVWLNGYAIASEGVPPTYVPARNSVFLALALAWAEVKGIADIFIGVNALDYSGYPDCRPQYVAAFESLANLACRSSVEEGVRIRLHAPLMHRTKAEIIRWGAELGVDYSQTWSCYAPRVLGNSFAACGECDSCLLRRKGFREAGLPDPAGPGAG